MLTVRTISLLLCCSGLAVGCGGGSTGGGNDTGETDTRTTAQQLAALKPHGIYFGHQSVGANIMTGVNCWLTQVPSSADRLARGGLASAAMGTWADGYVESNGHPLDKIANFQKQMIGGSGAVGICGKVDIAFMKFCWADTDAIQSAGAAVVLKAYDDMVKAVTAACPTVTLVHFTMPLETGNNAFRESYNELVRAKYGDAVFDLAAWEATQSDGSQCTSGGVRILCDGYDDKGSANHLNDTGQHWIAAKLIAFLANLSE
jgi:hypothetical protein